MTQTSLLRFKESNDSLETWEREGVLILPDVLSAEQCGQLKAEALKILQKHARAGATVYVGCAAVSDAFRNLTEHPRVLAALEKIMPDGIEFLSDKLVYKNAAKSFATPWHIDALYWKKTRPKLSVWIPLDDATRENATLTLIPGSHRKEWRYQSAESSGEFSQTIRDADVSADQVVVAEIPRGTAIIFSDRVVHGSTATEGTNERYAIISTYHAPGQESFDEKFPARKVLQSRRIN